MKKLQSYKHSFLFAKSHFCQVSEANCLPPDGLRRALSSVYFANGRFKAGAFDETVFGWRWAPGDAWGELKNPIFGLKNHTDNGLILPLL